MSYFIRCQWRPEAGRSVDDRVVEAGALLQSLELVSFLGTQWYNLGNSKREALSKPIKPGSLASVGRPWKRTKMGAGWHNTRLLAWNGKDDLDAADLSVTIVDADENEAENLERVGLAADTLVISFHGRCAGSKHGRVDVFDTARTIADRLGGAALVTSHDVVEAAEARGMRNYMVAGYAAFWGVDRSGRNPQYTALRAKGIEPPYSFIVERDLSRKDVDLVRLQEVADLLDSPRSATSG